ncbi:MAG: lipid II flippase MurJ [Desulfobacterales bacterium]
MTSSASNALYRKIGIASVIMMVFGIPQPGDRAGSGNGHRPAAALVRPWYFSYQIVFVLPEILNHIVASGFLSVVFIPIFSRYLADNRETEGWRVFSIIILTGFGTLLLFLIGIGRMVCPGAAGVLAPGITDPSVKADAIHMTRIILPAQFFFFTGGMLSAVQFAKEQFAIPALAPLIYNLGIIGGGVLLYNHLGMAGFSWGVLAGAFIGNFALQIRGARRAGLRFSLIFNMNHPDFKKYILLTLPLMLGLTMTFSTEFFLKFFGSFLPEGRIAALNYSLRVMLILVAFFGQAVGVASFPFMARLAAEKKLAEMNQLLNDTLRYLALVIPFSVLFMVLRHEVIMILVQRGRFDAAATVLTADILVYIMAGAVCGSDRRSQRLFAVQNTLFPAVYGTLAVIVSLPIYYVGMQYMGGEWRWPCLPPPSSRFSCFTASGTKKSRNTEYPAVARFYVKIIC